MAENFLSPWTQVLQFPQNVSISAFAEYKGNLFAVGGMLNESECIKLYLSTDNGTTWRDIETIPTDISFASALIISDDRIFIAGRKGKSQQEWVGAVYSCYLKDVL